MLTGAANSSKMDWRSVGLFSANSVRGRARRSRMDATRKGFMTKRPEIGLWRSKPTSPADGQDMAELPTSNIERIKIAGI